MLTRRFFVRGSAMVMAGAGSVPFWLARAAALRSGQTQDPGGDFPARRRRRPERGGAVRREALLRTASDDRDPGARRLEWSTAAIDLDGRFALNPALQPLKALWDRQQLAIVEATGSPDPTRSHFDAQDQMESGTPGRRATDGSIGRCRRQGRIRRRCGRSRWAHAAAHHARRPLCHRGEGLAAVSRRRRIRRILESMYAKSCDQPLARTGKDAFAAMKMIESFNQQPNTPSQGAQYGQGGELGRSLQQIARLIKADVGVEAAFAEIGGWDHHGNENPQLRITCCASSAARWRHSVPTWAIGWRTLWW